MASAIGHTQEISLQKLAAFPQEIIDLVLEVTSAILEGRDARRALEACSLVSQSFGIPARKLLHSSIMITEGPSSKFKAWKPPLYRLLTLVENRPDFTSLIRKFHVSVGVRNEILSAHVLSMIFNALRLHAKNLQIIWITGIHSSPFAWLQTGPAVLQSFLDLLSSVELRGLRYTNVSHLTPHVVTRCPSLRSLELISASFVDEDKTSSFDKASHPSPKPIRLNELIMQPTIRARAFTQDLPRLNVSLSNLVRLQASTIFSSADAAIIWSCVQEAKSSLASLDLMVGTKLLSTLLRESSIDIGQLPTIRNLRLRIRTPLHRNLPSTTDVFSLIDPSTHPTSLKSIELLFESNMITPETLHFPPDADTDSSWSQLKLINLRQKHPDLQTIYIKLDIKPAAYVSFTNAKARDIGRSIREELLTFILHSSTPPLTSPSIEVDVSIL